MNINQSRIVPSTDPWEPHFCGPFFMLGNVPHFAYEAEGVVHVLSLECNNPLKIDVDLTNSLSSNWMQLVRDGKSFLAVKPEVIIDLQLCKRLAQIPEALRTDYLDNFHPEMYFETHSFTYDDFCICHKGRTGYSCIRNGQEIWSFIGYAYLYTDIARWNDRIFFGTAGQGGCFYVLELSTGKVLTAIQTGGTAAFVLQDHYCYITAKANKKNLSVLLCVNLNDGQVIEKIELYGEVNCHSKIQMVGGRLHVITFVYKKQQLQHAIWNEVNI